MGAEEKRNGSKGESTERGRGGRLEREEDIRKERTNATLEKSTRWERRQRNALEGKTLDCGIKENRTVETDTVGGENPKGTREQEQERKRTQNNKKKFSGHLGSFFTFCPTCVHVTTEDYRHRQPHTKKPVTEQKK